MLSVKSSKDVKDGLSALKGMDAAVEEVRAPFFYTAFIWSVDFRMEFLCAFVTVISHLHRR